MNVTVRTGDGWAVTKRGAVLAAIAVGLVAVTWLVLNAAQDSSNLAIVVIVATLAVLWLRFRRRFETPLLSPVWLALLSLSAIGVLGYWFGEGLEGRLGGGIVLALDPSVRHRTIWVYALSVVCLTVGALVASAAIKRPASGGGLADLAKTRVKVGLILLAAPLPMLLIVSQLGSTLLLRDTYLAGSGGSNLYALGLAGALGAEALLGFACGRGRPGQRFIAGALAVAYVLMFFSLASRQLALAPIAFALGYLASRARRGRLVLTIAVLLAAAVLPLPLYLRGQLTHGFYPYLAALPHFSYADVDLRFTANNVLISYPITGETAFTVNPIPASTFWIEINPLPGNIAGWYNVSNTLTLNGWTPYSAVGEFWNYGMPFLIGGWAVIGAVLAYLDSRVRHYVTAGRAMYGVAIVGLAALFSVQMLQYNIRSSTRDLVYAIVVDVAARVIVGMRRANSSATAPTPLRLGSRVGR